jgi:predicted SAM-dependent methyltransferase
MSIRSIIKKIVPPAGRKFYRTIFKEKAKIECRKKIEALGEKIKLIVGTGHTQYTGWVSTDIHELNILSEQDWQYLLRGKKVTNILSEHVWEHIELEDSRKANRLCFHYLGKNGRMRIAVPDGFFPDEAYIEYVRPGGSGPGCEDHKLLYNYRLLSQELEKAGFKVELLEYWDEHGQFHYKDWSPEEGGMVGRSSRFDPSNAGGTLKYTSLIVDAVKS